MSNQVPSSVEAAMRYAPAAERNKSPLSAILKTLLPETGSVLEIASGTGQHIVHFACQFPRLFWQPSEAQPELLSSIRAHMSAHPASNIAAPIHIDVHRSHWSSKTYDAVLAINLIHIAPWSATKALFQGSAQHLGIGGSLITYGPYRFFGYDHADSNRTFDARLRAENPNWGVRDIHAIGAEAARFNLALKAALPMPANNHVLVFTRQLSDDSA